MKFFSLKLLFLLWGVSLSAQKAETQFLVMGNCGMCKTSIETAANIKGVSKAEWNIDTHILKLVYKPKKVSVDAVKKAIAASGYDNDVYHSDSTTYTNLHTCCKYRGTKP